jgi:primosomal protein N' (replication factor Y)
VVLGTRSAIFTPLARPGLIVVDEEHDGSYKQQDGFRYHARDLAVMRAQADRVPVVLGSATPSLESLHNARRGRFTLLELPARPGAAELPEVHLLDLRTLPVEQGISRPLRQALRLRLERGEQSLLFLNRRGFAPVLMCYQCGWLAACQRCDARMTLHRGSGRLRCHHCGAESALPTTCGGCGGTDLHGIGEGTERIETVLGELFPAARVVRVDRDTTARKGALEESLRRIHAGEADILVGTQMLSKGHDFPAVTLVGVINADQGLFGLDFRAGEYLFQRIMQVAGRAGRADRPGQVLIQTWHPDNPYLQALARHDFNTYADYAMAEREEAELAPYAHLALLRAESTRAGDALEFLQQAWDLAQPLCNDPAAVTIMEPVPSPMERRAGRYRAQLLVQSGHRAALHRFLDRWLALLDAHPGARRVRWSLDVDPMDMY